jgi:flotillin
MFLFMEVFAIEMPKCKARTAQGACLEADCLAQVKIKSDEASIVAAAEHFLSKNDAEMQNLIKPVLERHLSSILGSMNREEIERDPASCAARMQTAAAGDLGSMGLGLVSFTIRDVRSG